MYLDGNPLEQNLTPINRKRVGRAAGGGEKVYVDWEQKAFWELEDGDLVDTADLCRVFGCSLQTIYRWMKSHQLRPVRKAGREFLFRKGDVVRWFDAHRPRPGRPPKGGRWA